MAGTERTPLVIHLTRAPPSSARNLKKYLVITAIVALHLVAGAGPAGIAAAQHLFIASAARDVRFSITIYDSKPVLGGALSFHAANGSSVFPMDDPMQSPITAEDIAGKALLWNNALFTRDSEKILQDKINFIESEPEKIGYYKNDVKIASATRPYRETPTAEWLQLLWVYGSSVWRGDKLAQDGTLHQAMLKAPLKADIERIFASLGVLKPLKQSAKTMLKERGISDRYATEILEPQVQRAFGQDLRKATGLTAMLAAAWEESANAYQGGDLVDRLQRIVGRIDVDVRTSTRVTAIRHTEIAAKRPAWLVRHESTAASEGGSDASSSLSLFDKVIIAALDPAIQLENSAAKTLDLTTSFAAADANTTEFAATMRDDPPSVPAHVTFFTSAAALPPWAADEEDQALFLDSWRTAGMRELALVRELATDPDAEPAYLYRVLSEWPVLEDLRRRTEITWSYETTIEKAYPMAPPLQRFAPFALPWAQGLWWTSIIQRAATSVDLNWLAGKIVAEDLIKEVTRGCVLLCSSSVGA
ncbi:hypothetical protein GGS24DRAFT_198373 [Hypoxylon argillaceum]|nr:hypothetical protein GGS24DRAFT_198373 [Hypoxylon argillaceum]